MLKHSGCGMIIASYFKPQLQCKSGAKSRSERPKQKWFGQKILVKLALRMCESASGQKERCPKGIPQSNKTLHIKVPGEGL